MLSNQLCPVRAADNHIPWTFIFVILGIVGMVTCCLVVCIPCHRAERYVLHFSPILRLIYTRAKVKAKAKSLPTCCIIFNLCVYTTATAAATNIKEKNRFRFLFKWALTNSVNASTHTYIDNKVSKWIMMTWRSQIGTVQAAGYIRVRSPTEGHG